jgi:CBS domain-containing protein
MKQPGTSRQSLPAKWLRAQRKKLEEERSRLREQIDRETTGLETTGTSHPREGGDRAEEAREDEEVSGVIDELRSRFQTIEEALERIASKRYGECIGCGAIIPRGRLEAVPFAVRCSNCQMDAEREAEGGETRSRPVFTIDETEVTAADLMQTDVAKLLASAPIESALGTFQDYHISGAPVVNEAGELVGVLSASDLIRSEHTGEGGFASRESDYYMSDEASGEEPPPLGDDYSTPTIGQETVGDWMNARIISVAPDATLGQVCEQMRRESVHRVFVVDEKQLLGVVSSTDLVRYVASACAGEEA